MIEIALVHELRKIPELTGSAYPLNAPEGETRPHVVYSRLSTERDKTLDDQGQEHEVRFMFSVLATKYSSMKTLSMAIQDLLLDMQHTLIGDGDNRYYVQDIEINSAPEVWEKELLRHRGVIDFTIFPRRIM